MNVETEINYFKTKQKLFLTFKTIFVQNMFSPCAAKRRGSDNDLPVRRTKDLLRCDIFESFLLQAADQNSKKDSKNGAAQQEPKRERKFLKLTVCNACFQFLLGRHKFSASVEELKVILSIERP